jgi:hypothetical protein
MSVEFSPYVAYLFTNVWKPEHGCATPGWHWQYLKQIVFNDAGSYGVGVEH